MTHNDMETLKPVPAKTKNTNTFASVVWLIPLIALIAGLWLLVQNIRNTGPDITLLMDSADGIEINNTVIKVLSVEVGRVTAIKLREDKKGVAVTARLTADAKDMMRKDTQFWVVKPRIDQSGITGLNTLVSGSYISFTPGKMEESEHTFTVLDIPPIAAIGQSGLRLNLVGNNDKMLSIGSPVVYENFTVGQIENAVFNPEDQTVRYTVFIQSPNDKLINGNSQFWLESGLHIQAKGDGIRIDTAPIPALLSGAIAFSSPTGNDQGKPVENNAVFQLYNNHSQIENLPGERALYYIAFFKQSIRGLTEGSPVEYKGINIGAVAEAPYFDKNDSTRILANGLIPVRIRIEPSRLEINAERQSKEFWAQEIQMALNKGLTATLTANNLITGSKMIELTDRPSENPKLKPHNHYAGSPVIASQEGGLDAIQAQLNNLLGKLNKLPLDKTVNQVNATLAELQNTLKSANALVNRPQTKALPQEINKTLTELRQTLQGVSPQSPLYHDVQSTLQNIDKTLRDMRPVINNLKEKPNSLIFQSNIKDPIPKGNQ
ncbi:intermembrane transport protein PqiB [Neisseria weaveri]|uniref:intermembrane transport protein PqiB n=1 Tax=Neisseria weaveri TaxID=28091 RepID=UPI000682C9FE